MLTQEWIAAVLAEDPTVKEAVAVDLYALADRIYMSRAGDSRFTGNARHRDCARWIMANQQIAVRFRRFINRGPWAKRDALDRDIGALSLRRALISLV